MSGVNKVILLGNVGRDPDIRALPSGVFVASFSLATNEIFRDKNTGEKREETEWHNIVMWRNIAESLKKAEVKKGDRIYLEGKIKTRKWQDKEESQRVVTEVVADTFTIVNRKRVPVAGQSDEVSPES